MSFSNTSFVRQQKYQALPLSLLILPLFANPCFLWKLIFLRLANFWRPNRAPQIMEEEGGGGRGGGTQICTK